ncbi:MAG TPA: hypothetical protein VG435_17220 [Acidimicrobiales bacterium]|nr:hypothetical protein [Acidimicrobiales bacterium]
MTLYFKCPNCGLVDLDAGHGCERCAAAAETERPRVDPAEEDYRARVDAARRIPVAGGVPVRCGQCRSHVGRLTMTPFGLLLRAYERDLVARLARDSLGEELGLEADTLTTKVWILDHPKTPPIALRCAHLHALAVDVARCTNGLKTGRDVYLPTIAHISQRST